MTLIIDENCRLTYLANHASTPLASAKPVHILTMLSEPLMVELTQQMLQLQSLPILLLEVDQIPGMLRAMLEHAPAR